MTHSELVEHAFRWVLSRSCGVAFKELKTLEAEIPDVIGFGSSNHSVLVECKVSRSDFLCDKKKFFRLNPPLGVGRYRYYACPEGLIKIDELPENWGLVYVKENGKVRCVHNPYGKSSDSNIYNKGFEQNIKAEQSMMYSALRRLFIKGYVKFIYDKEYNYGLTNTEIIDRNEITNQTLTT